MRTKKEREAARAEAKAKAVLEAWEAEAAADDAREREEAEASQREVWSALEATYGVFSRTQDDVGPTCSGLLRPMRHGQTDGLECGTAVSRGELSHGF